MLKQINRQLGHKMVLFLSNNIQSCTIIQFLYIYVFEVPLNVADRDWSGRELEEGFNVAEKFLLIRIKTDGRAVSSLPGPDGGLDNERYKDKRFEYQSSDLISLKSPSSDGQQPPLFILQLRSVRQVLHSFPISVSWQF